MTTDELERAVVSYLDLRASSSGEAPDLATFAGQFGTDAAEVVGAVEQALELENLFVESDQPVQPTQLGPWRIEEEIGRGGVGVVYRAHHASDGAAAALKLLPRSVFANPRTQLRFRRESQLLRELNHPNIVKLLDVGESIEGIWMALELIEGTPLDQLAPESLSETEAIKLVRKIGVAVAAAHSKGLIHRDLKPGNVVLSQAGEPVLLDFGLGADLGGTTFTVTGEVMGTPRYMAPEQVSGQAADARTDVYALGLILLELLTGTMARPQESRDAVLLAAQQNLLPKSALHRLSKSRLKPTVMKALQQKPERRFPTAQSFNDALQCVLDGAQTTRRPMTPRAKWWWLAGSVGCAVLVIVCLQLGWARHWFGAPPPSESESSPAADLSRGVDALLKDAQAAWAARESMKTVALARRVLAQDPQSWQAWAMVAEASSGFDPQSSIEALERLESGPRPLTRGQLRLYAQGLDRVGRGKEAQECLRDLLRSEPSDGRSWQLLARVLDRAHDLSEALPAYEKALKLRATSFRLKVEFANFLLGGDQGRCDRCDAAYAAHPAILDVERAQGLLTAALRGSRRLSSGHAKLFLDVALKVENREALLATITELRKTGRGGETHLMRLQQLSHELRVRAPTPR